MTKKNEELRLTRGSEVVLNVKSFCFWENLDFWEADFKSGKAFLGKQELKFTKMQ